MWAVLAACLLFAAGAAAEPGKDALFVSAGGRNYILKREASVLGDKYTAEDDPATVFWSAGKSAGLTIRGKEYTRYVLLRLLPEPEEDMLMLTVDGKNYKMRQAVSASGVKYEDIGDPTTVFWSKGTSAILTIKGKDYPGYETWEPLDVIWLAP
jgi:membrane-bound inhibitor of C-type lysozyme